MVNTNPNILKIGITGSSGTIGKILQKNFKDKYQLFLFDIKENSLNNNIPYKKVDFAKKEGLAGIFNGLDIIIHLTGNSNPSSPLEVVYNNNFLATTNVFEEAKFAGVKKIIFASSNYYHEKAVKEIISGYSKKIITLDFPPSPICLYGESKVYGEYLGRSLSYRGIKFIALRIGWVVPHGEFSKYNNNCFIRSIFCSEKDLVQAFEKSIHLETNDKFIKAFVVSKSNYDIFDLSETENKLGFIPQDHVEDYLKGKNNFKYLFFYKFKRILRKILVNIFKKTHIIPYEV